MTEIYSVRAFKIKLGDFLGHILISMCGDQTMCSLIVIDKNGEPGSLDLDGARVTTLEGTALGMICIGTCKITCKPNEIPCFKIVLDGVRGELEKISGT